MQLHLIVYAVGAIFVGRLTDKYGARWVMTGGGLILLTGLCLLATVKTIWQFYLYYAFITGIGVTATLIAPNAATARKWFTKKSGMAVGIVYAGGGLGFGVVSLIIAKLIGHFNWRTCYIIVGLGIGLLVMTLSFLIVRKDPESVGLLPDGEKDEKIAQAGIDIQGGVVKQGGVIWTINKAMRTSAFWYSFFAYGASVVGLHGVYAHMGFWCNDIAAGQQLTQIKGTIATAMMVLALSGVVSKLIAGYISDKIGKKPIIYLSYIVQICAFSFALTINSLSLVIVFALGFGIGFGMSVPMWAPLLGDIFGRKIVASLFGLLVFSSGIIGGIGPTAFGWLYDVSGSYNWSFIFGIVILSLTLLLAALIKPIGKRVEL